jgi:ABC-type sugar transport system ATPase subunit
MRRKLKQLHQQLGTSTIYVTHDQSDALALADRLAVLNRGKVEQVGTPREVYDWPASPFVAGFVGSPSMNLFRGQRVEGATEGAWRLSVEGWSIQVEGPWWRAESALTAVVGLRPEDIHLRPVGQPERGQPERGQPEMGQPEMGQPEGGPPDPSWASCPAARGRVDLIEDLGDTRVVSLTLDHDEQTKNRASPERPGAVLLCKRQDRSGLARGEHVIAWFDMRRAHWFDGLTGRNLRQPGAR